MSSKQANRSKILKGVAKAIDDPTKLREVLANHKRAIKSDTLNRIVSIPGAEDRKEPLTFCCERDLVEQAEILLRAGAGFAILENGSIPLLFRIVENNSIKCLDFIVKNFPSLNLNTKDRNGFSLVHVAVVRGNLPMLQRLQSLGCSLSQRVALPTENDAIPTAGGGATSKTVDSAKYEEPFHPATKISAVGMTPFLLAVRNGHLEIARFLYGLKRESILETREKWERSGWNALMIAVNNNRLDMVDWILSCPEGPSLLNYVTPSSPWKCALLLAMKKSVEVEGGDGGQPPHAMLKKLLDHPLIDVNVKIGPNEMTPLHMAMCHASYPPSCIRHLLSHPKIEPNPKTKHGKFTPLHIAVRMADCDKISAILEAGSGLSKVGKVVKCGEDKFVDFLRKRLRQEVSVLTSDTRSFLLQRLDIQNQSDLAQVTSPFVDVNAKTNFGWTPLHIASRMKTIRAFKDLLSHGASLNIKDDHGYVPLDKLAATKRLSNVRFPKAVQHITQFDEFLGSFCPISAAEFGKRMQRRNKSRDSSNMNDALGISESEDGIPEDRHSIRMAHKKRHAKLIEVDKKTYEAYEHLQQQLEALRIIEEDLEEKAEAEPGKFDTKIAKNAAAIAHVQGQIKTLTKGGASGLHHKGGHAKGGKSPSGAPYIPPSFSQEMSSSSQDPFSPTQTQPSEWQSQSQELGGQTQELLQEGAENSDALLPSQEVPSAAVDATKEETASN